MTKYLFRASYTPAGIAGIVHEGGSARSKAIETLVGSVGGTIECFYWGFGQDDFFLIAELPDNVAAAALSTTVAAAGVASIQTTPLLSADDIDQVRSRSVDYTPPRA